MSDDKPPATWRKSSRCTGNGADCVEVTTANLPGDLRGVRDSTEPNSVLTFPAAGFAAFVAAINSGQFNQPVC